MLFIADGHCDTLLDLNDGKRKFSSDSPAGHLDLPKMLAGGINLQIFAAFIQSQFKPERSLTRGLELVNGFLQLVENHSEHLVHIKSKADLVELYTKRDKIGALLSIEGGEAIAGKLYLLEVFYRLGLRCLTLTWNHRNEIADGVGEGPSAGGLTVFGKKVIRRMNELGMIIDVSHLSDVGFWDVLSLSQQPVIASHSNCRQLCAHRRNLTDDQIKALAQNGGVVGVTFAGDFIDPFQPSLVKLVDHIEHIVDLVGVAHVGIGSDFDGVDQLPAEIPDAAHFPVIIEELKNRGVKDDHIKAIMGDNFYRVFGQILR